MRIFITLCCLATAYAANLAYGAPDGRYIPVGGNTFKSPTPAEYEKEFFTFSAPEDAFEDSHAYQPLTESFKRNLRVIFIKGPENSGLENVAVQLAKLAAEQRTAIYVLNKQVDISGLANKLNTSYKNNANKPEVHFVKYRTPAEAENAQRAIQAQYEGLGGKSSNHNGGVAPVLDFASKVPLGSNGNNIAYPSTELANIYLPTNQRF